MYEDETSNWNYHFDFGRGRVVFVARNRGYECHWLQNLRFGYRFFDYANH